MITRKERKPPTLLRDLQAATAQLRRLTMQQNRLNLARTRHDTRDWAQERRNRTRQLTELGSLMHKADLAELPDIAGWLQEQEDKCQEGQEETPANLKARWRRRGLRAFDVDNAAAAE